jgi:LPS sulfotransferase NodH
MNGELYSESYDYACFDGELSKTFIVATIPRSGSTLYCCQLWKSGALGAPAEYVNPYIVSRLYERLQATSMLDY